MRIVLLSGGSGKRLWPLSNDIRSKQFLKLLQDDDGIYESMVQRVYRQIKSVGIDAPIVISTGAGQEDSIKNHLGDAVDIVLEPERRNTFPAIALASSFLKFEKNCDDDEVVVILPVDPYAEDEYFNTLLKMEQAVKDNVADLVLMGINPTYPSEKYGYIVPFKGQTVEPKMVERFTEKPTEQAAMQLIADGAVWNGGVFAFKLGWIMDILHQHIEASSYQDVHSQYGKLKKDSFDYEVAEKTNSIACISYDGIWKDLGTWNTLTEQMTNQSFGRVIFGEKTEQTHVINQLDIPIVALGLKDVVVAASPDGILISDKQKSSYLKPYVENLDGRARYEERRWGEYNIAEYTCCEDGTKSLTKNLIIKKGHTTSYHSHSMHDEIWTFIDGNGELLVDGEIKPIKRGDTVHITIGMKHAIRAITDIRMVEIQLGKELSESDKKFYDALVPENFN